MKRYAFSLFFLGVFICGLSFQPLAQAIPSNQGDCDSGSVTITSDSFSFVPGSVVTVDNGTVSRTVIITFSATATILQDEDQTGYEPPGVGTIHLAYSIDGGACTSVGPTAFYSGRSDDGIGAATSTNVSVRTLGSGIHTIRPCFRPTGNNEVGSISGRCLTVE